ncbi:MAG: hypothetical protein K2H45_09230 [Acetatifactor sp.]|nr:hypothetical protein [Acetatifactor sp.]
MKKEQLSDALNMLDDTIIEETAEIRNHKRRWRKSWGIWAATAACLALLTYAGIRVLPQPSQDIPSDPLENPADPTGIPTHTPVPRTPAPGNLPEISGSSIDISSPPTQTPESPDHSHIAEKPMQNLPLLSISENNGDDMGYEGYLAYDVSELVNGNPWDETMELSSLPVYQNRLTSGYRYIASGVEYKDVDFDEVREFLLDIAGRLELNTSSFVITDNAPDEKARQEILEKHNGDVPEGYFNPTALIIQTDGMKINVDQTLHANIAFDPPIALPDKYNFNHHAPYEDYIKVAEYLKKEYAQLIGMDNPQISISGGDYNIYLQQSYDIYFYDVGCDDIEQIINYNFHTIRFCCNDDGKLFLIWIRHPDLSLKVGNYPIITADEARELLSAGNYITTVPYEMPGMNYVKKVELIYRTSSWEQYFMPYYRFYVELPDVDVPTETSRSGIKTYGAYYVPAVEGRYLTNMPVRNGQIN